MTPSIAFTAIAAGAVGLVAGLAASPSADPPPPTTITREVVPASCVEAIHAAREGFTLSSEFTLAMSSFLDATVAGDLEAMTRQTQQVNAINAALREVAPRFVTSAADCEAS